MTSAGRKPTSEKKSQAQEKTELTTRGDLQSKLTKDWRARMGGRLQVVLTSIKVAAATFQVINFSLEYSTTPPLLLNLRNYTKCLISFKEQLLLAFHTRTARNERHRRTSTLYRFRCEIYAAIKQFYIIPTRKIITSLQTISAPYYLPLR